MKNNRICVIFAGGPERGLPCIPVPAGAYLLCADSGLKLCSRLGLKPDLVLGDFDSLGAEPTVLPHITAQPEKDDTDTMLAVRQALSEGFRDIRIYGAFGGRLDHTLANLQTLEFLRQNGASGMLIGAGDWACLLPAGETGRYVRQPDFTLSVFAWSGTCRGVCIRGTKYTLEQGELSRSFPLGVSNEITAEAAEVSCTEGVLLIAGSAAELTCRNAEP